MLTTGNYGLASELLAYIALLQVVLTFGLETGFFRFASKEKSRAGLIFSTALFSPVSYTHLDVYNRQILGSLVSGWMIDKFFTFKFDTL